MSTPQTDTTDLRTVTDYGTHSLNSETVIRLSGDWLAPQDAKVIARHLWKSLETNESDAYLRLLSVLIELSDALAAIAADTESGEPVPAEYHCAIEVEIEGASAELSERITAAFEKLETSLFEVVNLRLALEEATRDQPRSIIRVVEGVNGYREADEWHTDTNADWSPTPM